MKRPAFLNHIGGRFSRGVFWNALGTLFTQGSTFLTGIVLARLLGQEIFGQFVMIQSTLLTLTSVAQIATGYTATRYIAEFRDTNKLRAGRILGLCAMLTWMTGILASLLLLTGSGLMSESILESPHLETSIELSAPFVLFAVMHAYQIGALAGLECYKSISIYGAIAGLFHLLVCVAGAHLWGLNGAILAMVTSSAMRWWIFSFALRREARKQNIKELTGEWLKERKIIFQFILPAALAGSTSMPAIWYSNALLVRQESGYLEMGLFAAINSVRGLVLILPILLNNVGAAVLNNLLGNSERTGYVGLFYKNIKITVFISAMGAALFLAAQEIIPVLYGMEASRASMLIISIFSIGVVVESLAASLYQIVQTTQKMWLSFFAISSPRDLLMVFMSLLLVPKFGGIGLAVAHTTSWIFALIIIYFITNNLKKKFIENQFKV